MADPARGMGRGLAAILSSGRPDVGDELRDLPLDVIVPNPRQPRRSFDEEALEALADSVRERGVLQPVLVRPLPGGTYELIAGERRWRAAQRAELDAVPAIVRPHDDAASLELALIENMAREDLNPIEEARACAALVEELGLTHEQVGKRVGRSRVAVSNLLRLLDLPDEALAAVESGSLTEGHGRALLLAADHGDRRRLAREAVAHGWSVRELERRAREASAPARAPHPKGGAVALHPDHAAALADLAESLTRALGTEVDVRPAGEGCHAELRFETLEEARAVVGRIGARAAA